MLSTTENRMVWVTYSGKQYRIYQMRTGHLYNCIVMTWDQCVSKDKRVGRYNGRIRLNILDYAVQLSQMIRELSSRKLNDRQLAGIIKIANHCGYNVPKVLPQGMTDQEWINSF